MHLTFFNSGNLRVGRGSEQVLLNLVKNKPKNINITIVQTDASDFERLSQSDVDQIIKGCELITIRTFVNSYRSVFGKYSYLVSKLLFKDVRMAKRGSEYNRIRDTDFVYLFGNSYSVFFSGLHIPIIGSNHNFDPSYFFSKEKSFFVTKLHYLLYFLLKITIFRNINGFHLFPHNKDFISLMRTKYNFVLSNGVDSTFFHPAFTGKNKKIKLLFVGALTNGKGLDILIPIMNNMAKMNNIELHIVGTGPLEDEIRKINKVIYHGKVNEKELAEIYSNSDIFFYPSHDDNCPLAVLQALSSGLYVITGSYLTGVFDDFKEQGYLEYITLNTKSFYERIKEIENGTRVPNINRMELYDYVRKNYDWKTIAENFYSKLLEIKKISKNN